MTNPKPNDQSVEALAEVVDEPQKPVESQSIKPPIKQSLSQPIFKNGRDEMNLVEYPFALLSTRSNPEVKTIEITKQGTNKKGELIEQKWIVTGSDKWGLPTTVGEEVYIALMALTHQDGFTSQEISFQGIDALRQLGWPLEGKSYWRLRKALRVLKGVSIYAENLFYDNKIKDYVTEKAFGVIADYDWYGDESKTIKINWDKVLWTSFKNNYIKAIDTEFYFSLNSAIAQRLYRILDKRFYHKKRVEFDLRRLAFDHLLMSQKYHGGEIKRRLSPAIEELITSGYLKSYEYQPATGRTKSVIFYRGKTTQTSTKKVEPQPQPEPTKPDSLAYQLMRYGMPDLVTRQLVENYPDRIEAQIRYHEYRLQYHADKVSKNPAGFLRKAIEGNWTAPPDYISPEEQERSKKKAAEQQKRQEHRWKVEEWQQWQSQTPEQKVTGELWQWSRRFEKENSQLPTTEERQVKQAKLIQALPTDEERYQQIFGKRLKKSEALFDE